ncbi:MAG: lanthionine synthetase LanC family protein [Acidimicrobiia bacterium]
MAVAVTVPFEDLAAGLGDRLCREAIWHEDRCTWLGDDVDVPRGAGAVVHRSVGPDLYNGTAGIGWLLAHLGRRTGRPEHRRAAAGALRHALSRWDEAPAGLYTGRAGISLAAVAGGRVLGDEGLVAAGEARAAEVAPEPGEADLIGGAAGTVVALLALGRGAEAAEAGELLLGAAVRSDTGWWWPSPPPATEPPLCGMGHGASGIGLALLELASATADDRYREAGLAAFAYERGWFNRDAGGWPDLRELDWSRLHLGDGPQYPAFWCHGGPGIGVARLRGYSLTADLVCLAEAAAAIDTATAGALRAGPGGHQVNLSLCHGAGSVIELHLLAAEVTGDDEHLAMARRLGELGLRGLDPRLARDVPCGVPGGGETPGLLLGLAGVAATLLRLADPSALPSPLLVGAWL